MTERLSSRALLMLVMIGLVMGAAGCGVAGSGGAGGGGGGGGGGSQPLLISTTSLPFGVEGRPYSYALQASGGLPPYRWSVPSPMGLPAGIQLSADGTLSGLTSFVGQYFTTYQVSDSSSSPQIASISLGLTMLAPLTIQTTVLPSSNPPPNVGVRFAALLSATGGYGTYTWKLQPSSGPLPPGITLNSTLGIISGIPTVAGTYSFAVEVDNAGPPQQMATQNYSLTITNNLVILALDGYLLSVVTKPFQKTLQALGGQPPYTWGLVGKSQLAPGLSLDSASGTISGSPTEIGSFATGVQVTDSSSSQPQTTQTTITVAVNQVLHFYQTILQDAVAGQTYFGNVPALGGIAPYTMRLTAGSLPSGINLQSSNAQLAGISNTVGTSTFTIEVSDSEIPPASVQQSFVLRVNPRLDFPFATLPNALVGMPYSYTFQASGGLPPLHWTLSPYIPVPSWLTMDPLTGAVSGTPTQALQNQFSILLSDSSNPPQTAGNNAFLLVLGRLQITTSALPTLMANAPLRMQLGASGGIGQYTWTMTSGTLPNGIAFDPATGTISGQATQTGASAFSVQVSDAGPPSQTSIPQTLQLTVGTNLGRNDSPATATPLSNGTYQASVSPYADPPTGVGNPDSDYFKLTANPGATVTLDGRAARLIPPSPLEPVLEIVDAIGHRLSICTPGKSLLGPFNQLCLSVADSNTNTSDPTLLLQVPTNASGPMTFYAHMLDYRGDARPDFIYTITISGAN